MLPNKISHYCQKCLAGNPLGQEFCGRCGTRLMIVIEPRAARFELESEGGAGQEDHLLERVSALEYRLLRITDRLDRALDLMLRQAQTAYVDHALIESLIAVLAESGTIEVEKLRRLWAEHCERDATQQNQGKQFEELRRKIIAHYRGPEQAAFEKYVREGTGLLEAEDGGTRGVRLLERAALISRDNLPLLLFLGQYFFRQDRTALARDYLSQALEQAPNDAGICLLLGLTCGDEGDAARARELLERASSSSSPVPVAGTKRGAKKMKVKRAGSFAAHYGLGRLLVAEGCWTRALDSFKQALAARPCAEAHYVLGSVYYALERDRTAARHLHKALELDENYAAAYHLLGLVQLRAGESERARESFEAARDAGSSEPRYRAAARRLRRPEDAPGLPPLFAVQPGPARKRLITGGDKRLAELLREDALSVVSAQE